MEEVKCHICDETSADKSLHSSHMVTSHKYFQCKTCSNVYATKYSYLNHVQREHGCKCDHCDTVLKSKRLLQQHCLENHPTQEVKCHICSETAANKVLLDSHMITIHKCLQCDICFKCYSNKVSLMNHQYSKHGLKCQHCDEVLKSKKILEQHCTEKHPTQEVTCHICDQTSSSSALLNSHLYTVHKYVKCDMCNRFYSNKESLWTHQYQQHGFKCEYCPTILKSKTLLEQHYLEKHRTQCHVCKEILGSKVLLEGHMITVHGFSKCEICSKMYAIRYSLVQHMRLKHPSNCEHCHRKHVKQDEKCNVCEETLACKSLLNVHLMNEHKFVQCEICSKLFPRKKSLSDHRHKSHSLKCEYCESRFPTRQALEEHCSEKHSAQEVKCHICSETLANKGFLTDHLVTVHRFVQCEMCPKLFTKRESMASHRYRKHSLEESFKCKTCELPFTSETSFKKHINDNHRPGGEDHNDEEESVDSTKIVSYECDECDEFFETFDELEQHNKIHIPSLKHCAGGQRTSLGESSSKKPKLTHKEGLFEESDEDESIDSIEIGKYECNECDRYFETFHELEGHKKIHIPRVDCLSDNSIQPAMEVDRKPLHQCDICNVAFEFSDDLEKHSKDHIKKEINLEGILS